MSISTSDPTPIIPSWGLEEQQTLGLWSWAHFQRQGFLCFPKVPRGQKYDLCLVGWGTQPEPWLGLLSV